MQAVEFPACFHLAGTMPVMTERSGGTGIRRETGEENRRQEKQQREQQGKMRDFCWKGSASTRLLQERNPRLPVYFEQEELHCCSEVEEPREQTAEQAPTERTHS
jgi:hypothetical protein